MGTYTSTKILELGSCAFRQWRAEGTHCKFIHGYRLMAKFWFECSELDHRNWAVNFGGLKELKAILQNQFDHTLCIAADDPLRGMFEDLNTAKGCRLRVMKEGVGIEKTAEWCFKAAQDFLQTNEETKERCWVSKVEVWEHDQNSATYEEANHYFTRATKL
jgi:6-pyruvoyltetrahydropterin/6-carboxytetrahydropterin synthase